MSSGIPSLLKKEEQINDEEKKEYLNINDVEPDFKLKKKCSTTLAPLNFKAMTSTHINSKRKTTADILDLMAELDINKSHNKKVVNPESLINEAIQNLNTNDPYEDNSDFDEEGSICPKFKKIKIFNSE